MKLKSTLLIMLLAILLFSCASIPKESVSLSESIGKGLNETQKTHLKLLNHYFDEKRENVDLVINELWIPKFAEEFYAIPQVQEKWSEVCNSNDPIDKLKFTTTVGIKIQEKINNKRAELIDPLNETEKILESKLLEHYNKLHLANSVVTNYLSSASKVKEKEIKLLQMLGIEQQEVENTISQINDVMGNINTEMSSLEQGEHQTQKYIEKLKEIINKLKKD